MALAPIPVTTDGSGPAGAIPVDLHGGAGDPTLAARVDLMEQALTVAQGEIVTLNSMVTALTGRVADLEAKP